MHQAQLSLTDGLLQLAQLCFDIAVIRGYHQVASLYCQNLEQTKGGEMLIERERERE